MAIKLGTAVHVKGTMIFGKVTHILWDTDKDPYHQSKYKVAGRYWLKDSLEEI